MEKLMKLSDTGIFLPPDYLRVFGRFLNKLLSSEQKFWILDIWLGTIANTYWIRINSVQPTSEASRVTVFKSGSCTNLMTRCQTSCSTSLWKFWLNWVFISRKVSKTNSNSCEAETLVLCPRQFPNRPSSQVRGQYACPCFARGYVSDAGN